MAITSELLREIFKGHLLPFTQRNAVEAAWLASPRCSTSGQPKQPAIFATTQVDRRGTRVRCSHPGEFMLSKYSFRHRLCSWKSLVAFGIALVIAVLVYQPLKIEGNSMAPLLSDDELIFINRLVYRFEPVQRGDVVVFWYPLDRTKSFIKRIVALPGETVEIRQGLVYVNGNRLPEPYVPSQYEDMSHFGPEQVPSESYFVMGDHRNRSNDSRVFGPVANRLVYGRAVFAYWPMEHFGSLSAIRTTEAKSR